MWFIFAEIKKNRHVVVTNDEIGDERSYLIPLRRPPDSVAEGDQVEEPATQLDRRLR